MTNVDCALRSLPVSACLVLLGLGTACSGEDSGGDFGGAIASGPADAGSTETSSDGASDGGRTDGADAGGTTGAGASTGPETTAGDDDSGTTDSTDDGGDTSTGSSPLLDVSFGDSADDGTTTGATSEGCDNVDLLFVVDNSASMDPFQQAITGAFPTLMQSWLSALPSDVDLHVGVTVTDRTNDGAIRSDCDGVPGSLVTARVGTNGTTGSGPPCNFDSGAAYMTAGPNLDQEFACAAIVGSNGNLFEAPVDRTIEALDPAMNAAGGCNEGFRRDDALLVVFYLTDEDDIFATTPVDDFNAVVASAGGVEQNVVFVVVNQGNPLYPDCVNFQTGYTDAVNVDAFTSQFTHVFEASICAPGTDYATQLSMAAGVVGTACNDFVPPAG